MNTAAAALDALLDPAAADAARVRAHTDGRAWGLCAASTDAPGALLDGLHAGADPAAAGRLVRAHRRALGTGRLPDPALPAAGEPLALRTAALGAWCAGAVSGLHDAVPERLATLDPDALEAYGDLVALAGVAAPARADEAGETALNDLTEHARVAFALIAAALAGPEFAHASD